ncbi:uncharacterized protein L199_005483 [Kwoniella botswanensis]|uniref:uncharacterized protein n=1 Tax=Kwoniella botswanensis TaxID=1268659 RepID=UPI00315CEFB2
MSLHRYFVPPPLALAVHPAPPPKPKPTDKEKDKKTENKKEKDAKDNKEIDKPPEEAKEKVNIDEEQKKKERGGPATPATPRSMVPEPATPAPGDGDGDGGVDTPEADDKAVVKDKGRAEKGKDPQPADAKKDTPDNNKVTSTQIKDLTPEPEPEASEESEKPLEPIRLLPPAPFRPIRTKLDLNPLKLYPPIPSDPRGAYHAYAKAVGNEVIYVDVTKDGWLTEQWKERSEREALKRLTGEWQRDLKRELEKQRESNKVRELPRTAEGILLELWNVLVEAYNHEIAVDEFWSKFDWTKESAKVHLSNIQRSIQEDETKDKNENKVDLEDAEVGSEAKNDQPTTEIKHKSDSSDTSVEKGEREEEVEWTKEGVEEILATIGVQCVYNVEKPSRHWSHPAGGYLLLSHNYFLLRTDMHINFKPEEKAGKFEVLVTSGHDRVFGEMVKAQREKEYRERKEREKKEKLVKEKENAKHKDNDDKDVGKKDTKVDDDKHKSEGKDKKDETPVPGTPLSNVKLIDGEVIVPAAVDAVALGDNNDEKVIIAIPVDGKADPKNVRKDEKHEAEAAIVPGPKLAPEEERKGNEKRPLGMDDIAKAFKALESSASKAVDLKDKEKEKEKVKLIWTWSERCEMWRWRNYEVGLHNVGPGGWEERDWKVFADGREVWDFDDDEAIVEVEEKDVHDWSL